MKRTSLIIAAICSLIVTQQVHAQDKKLEEVTLNPVPNEILILTDKFVKDEPAPGGDKLRIVVNAEMAVRNDPDTSRRQIVLKLKTKMSGGNISGTYSGEKVVVLKTYDSDVKELELVEPTSHDHIFDWTEEKPNDKKPFGWTHEGYKQRPNNKLPINHIFYDGNGNKTLRILLNTSIPAKVLVK